MKLYLPTAARYLYDCSLPDRSLVKNKWRGLVLILLYVANKGVHSVFDNAVKSVVLYIQRVVLLPLSHVLYIFHYCAKIIKSGAGSNHCAIQRKLFKIWALRLVVKSISFVSVGFSSKSLDLRKRHILLIFSKYK